MKTLLSLFLLTALGSCAPRIFYTGELYSYDPLQKVEVHYSEGRIGRPYQVIGTLVNGGEGLGQSQVEQAIVEKAKLVGAEAIVFYDLDVAHSESSAILVMKAKAIRYDLETEPIGHH